MVKALKIEIFLLCMIVLIGLAARSRRSLFSSTQQLLFSMLGYTSAAYIFFDMIWTLSDGAYSTPVGIAANWISNAVSFSLFAIACLIWFFYSETMQGSRLVTSRYRVVLVTLPTASGGRAGIYQLLDARLCSISMRRACIVAAALYMIQPIVSYCYVIYTSLHAFIQARRVESLQTKAIYRTLAFFAVPALVGGTFQVLFSVPGLCVGITLSILLLYIIYQEQLISTDPLTGLNNRNRFETYMLSLFSNVDQAEDVYLLMMDADGFKQINDRYGHVEGDHALQVVATALKDVCSAAGGFIARYGGDEFVVLQKAAAEQDIIDLCSAIDDELARAEVPYAVADVHRLRAGRRWRRYLARLASRCRCGALPRQGREKESRRPDTLEKRAHDRCDGRAPLLRLRGPLAITPRRGAARRASAAAARYEINENQCAPLS